MCTTPKVSSASQESSEVIKTATRADAASQKPSAQTRSGIRGIIAQNIKTSNNGLDDDVVSSKKKLLGE